MRCLHNTLLPLLLLAALPATAGIFDNPENLKVLPEDIPSAELRDTMRAFSLGTGLRCQGCHEGEGDDLRNFDFASDEKDAKKTARLMLAMVEDINARLANELGQDAPALVQVQCVTCHRGQEKPRMLAQLLVDAVDEDGLEGALARYRELRERYYGSHTFDFSEMTLVNVAQAMGDLKQMPAAEAFLDLNVEFNPDSVMTYLAQAQLLAGQGRKPAARVKLEHVLKLDPENRFAKRLLDGLD